jgi:hypothetical protein
MPLRSMAARGSRVPFERQGLRCTRWFDEDVWRGECAGDVGSEKQENRVSKKDLGVSGESSWK